MVCPFSWACDKELSSNLRAIKWEYESIDKDSYLGTNAFGAIVEVSREETRYYSMAINNDDSFEISSFDPDRPGDHRDFVAQIHMNPIEAKKSKLTIKSLVICKLISPYVSQNQDFEKATFKLPYEETNVYNYIHVKILELCFFDNATGIILHRAKTTLQN